MFDRSDTQERHEPCTFWAILHVFCVFSGEATNTNFIVWFATTGARTHDLPHSIDNTMAKRVSKSETETCTDVYLASCMLI
jgi:hypothetical protein